MVGDDVRQIIAAIALVVALAGTGCSSTLPRFAGIVIDNKPNGQGSVTFNEGVQYIGEFHDGKANGQGTITFPNGNKIFGEFRDGKVNGQGTLTFANGNKYVGEFRDNFQSGVGTQTYATGSKYVGGWSSGLRSGEGTITLANGNKYVGKWRDGLFNGQGTYTWPDGQKYVGEYKDDKPNGKGILTFANGDKYVGEFKDDNLNGQGTLYGPDGAIKQAGLWTEGNYVGSAPKVASAPPPATTPLSSGSGIPMEQDGGTFVVPVRINDAITLKFIIDSGAADVSIPADVVGTLIRTGTLTSKDFTGSKTYVLADGSKVPSATFTIRSLQVGGRVVNNVTGSVADTKGILLLGQSFLRKFNSWSIDNRRHVLVLD